MRLRSVLVMTVWLVGQVVYAGEMSYEETTKITGGSALSMMKLAGAFSKEARKLDKPIVTSVAVKGNRMARVSADSAEIIDLDAETITNIDKVKHQYSVVTFAQMKQAMEQAVEKAKTEQAKVKDPQPATNSTDQNVEMRFEAHARKTGATKQVSGIDTNEVILTLAMNGKDKTNGQQGAMAVTNDMWMAADLPGYAEVREFNQRFAAKMGSALASGPDMSAFVKQVAASDAMKGLAKEMADLKGVPVLQVMRMGMTADGQPLPAASEAPLPADSGIGNSDAGNTLGAAVAKSTTEVVQQTAAQEAASRVRGALGSSLGSAIGGFGGFGKKKKAASQDTPAPPSSTPQASAGPSSVPSPTAAVLIESVTEIGKFSQQVDSALMQVPAGYSLVQAPELKKMSQ